MAEGNKYFGAGDEETEIEICFYGEELITVPKVILDENGYLHIKKQVAMLESHIKLIL